MRILCNGHPMREKWKRDVRHLKTETQLDECPFECKGREASLQRPLTASEIAKLSSRARRAVESTPGQARICSYCGCVHLRERHANVPLGILDGKAGPGWHSRNFA